MATRASIKISDKDGNFIANIYHHYDGYPEYLGDKLVKLCKAPIVNGIRLKPGGERPKLNEVFNGFGCLVASIVTELKDEPGGVYLYTEDDYGQCNEDYLYEIIEHPKGGEPLVLVENVDGEPEFVEDILNRVNNNFRTFNEAPYGDDDDELLSF